MMPLPTTPDFVEVVPFPPLEIGQDTTPFLRVLVTNLEAWVARLSAEPYSHPKVIAEAERWLAAARADLQKKLNPPGAGALARSLAEAFRAAAEGRPLPEEAPVEDEPIDEAAMRANLPLLDVVFHKLDRTPSWDVLTRVELWRELQTRLNAALGDHEDDFYDFETDLEIAERAVVEATKHHLVVTRDPSARPRDRNRAFAVLDRAARVRDRELAKETKRIARVDRLLESRRAAVKLTAEMQQRDARRAEREQRRQEREERRARRRAEIAERSRIARDLGAVVYFVEAIGLDRVKIGKSRDLAARLAKLGHMNAAECRIVKVISGYTAEESALHRRFAAHRLRGEWFRFSPIAAEIAALESVNARPDVTTCACGTILSAKSEQRARAGRVVRCRECAARARREAPRPPPVVHVMTCECGKQKRAPQKYTAKERAGWRCRPCAMREAWTSPVYRRRRTRSQRATLDRKRRRSVVGCLFCRAFPCRCAGLVGR